MHGVSTVLAGIEVRVADWLMVPSFNGEGIQVTTGLCLHFAHHTVSR